MKKNFYIILPYILIILISGCAGYEPIFSSTSFKFKIANYSIVGEEIIGQRIYSKLYSASASEKTDDVRNIEITLNIIKDKNETARNSAGKIIEYKITLNAEIVVEDFMTKDEVLNQAFTSSLSYKVQDKYSDTLKLENQTIENLANNIYEKLLIQLSEKLQ